MPKESKKEKQGNSLLASYLDAPLNQTIANPVPQLGSDMAQNRIPIPTTAQARDVSANSNTEGLMIAPTDSKKSATQNGDFVIQPPSAYARLFAVKFLPLAWRITFGVAGDCWKTGDAFPFSFRREKEAELERVEWSDRAMNILRDINFFRTGVQHMGVGEMDGEGLLILIEEGFDYAQDYVAKPRDVSKPIIDTMSIPMFYVNKMGAMKKEDWNLDGTPKYWYINLNSNDGMSRPTTATLKFHCSRILHYVPDPVDSSTKGLSTLERCWQALVIGFNIDLGTGEAFFRWGIGHPVFTTEFDDIKQLKNFMDELGSPNRRTWHALLRGMKLEFAGAGGTALDFKSGKETSVYDEVSIGSQIPRPILKGEVAGVQTGSEVNERSYWGVLRRKQTAYTPIVWKMIAILTETGQIEDSGCLYDFETGALTTPENIIVRWTVHYVETEEQKVDILLKKVQILGPLEQIMTINEIRAYTNDLLNLPPNSLPPLPIEVGGQLLSIFESGAFRVENLIAAQQEPENIDPSQPEETPETGGGTIGTPPGQVPPEGLPQGSTTQPVVLGPGQQAAPGTANVEKQIVPPNKPGEIAQNPATPKEEKKEPKALGEKTGKPILGGRRINPGVSVKADPSQGARQIVDPRLPALTNTIQKLVPQVPKMKNPLMAPRKIGQKRRDEEGDEIEDEKAVEQDRIVGCPDHTVFRKNCPACVLVLNFKEDLAKNLITVGYSVNQVQSFTKLDRNKVNKIRQDVVEQNGQRH